MTRSLALARLPVLIAGGGIGGLSLSLAFAEQGIASTVLERAAAFTEVGAGIQLGPNAIKALRRLEVGEAVVRDGWVPAAVELRELTDARLLKRTPLGDDFARRYDAPYVMAYRPDVLGRLLERASGNPLIELRCGCEITGYRQDEAGVRLGLADGETVPGHALVGCDGLRSAVRAQLVGDGEPVASKRVGYRTTVPRDTVPPQLWCANAVIWVGSGMHVVHYPLRDQQWLNVVACRAVADDDPGDVAATLAHLAASGSPLLRWLADIEPWSRRRLYDREPIHRWVDGRVTLLGDAAHPMLPHLAQGAAMAVEDAVVLAQELAATPEDPRAAFARYAEARQPRTRRAQTLSRVHGDRYQAADAAFAESAPGVHGMQTLGENDWLYTFNAPSHPQAL